MRELTEALLRQSRLARAKVKRQEIDLSQEARVIAAALKRTAPARRVEFINWGGPEGPRRPRHAP
jgi:hypothetical protein